MDLSIYLHVNVSTYLNNYFNFHVCLSFRLLRLFIVLRPSVWKLTPVSAVGSQNVNNKSFLVCVKSEKYVFWVTLRLLGSIRQGKAEIPALQYFMRQSPSAIIKTHLNFSLPPQCWSQAFVCVSTPRIYPRSKYFLVTYHSKAYILLKLWP